ncbi:DUF7402 domain-containing protein [Vallitalea guaymasensis]|uniref:DUF7402 domain-containing protein n=1 Tax=Vallitalea guaymasensis TaxID=1185412 RepID=UPI000DE2E816|nr:discoidin domain-containing protein [Vallitalea guaymasensis]
MLKMKGSGILFATIIVMFMFINFNSSSVVFATYTPGTAPFINTWLVAGPFDNSINLDLSMNPKESDNIGGKTWDYFDDRLFNRNLDDYQDLYSYFKVKKGLPVTDRSVAYAHVYVYSPTSRSARFRTGCSGTSQVWINGISAGSISTAVEVDKDSSDFSIYLNEGWNKILVKQVLNRVKFWGFYGRVCDSNGNEISGLEYSTNGGTGELAVNTKELAFTDNNMPSAFNEWPYVWATCTRDTANWRPQASKFRFYAQGGTPGYTWSIESGSLPDGLTLASDGTIDGYCAATDGKYDFVVKVTDSVNSTATKALTIEVKERPNKWLEQARQIALISCGPTLNVNLDPNYSADLWAERAVRQGIQAVYFEAGQQTPIWWPSVYAPAGTKDSITPYMEEIKRHGLRWGIYYPSEGAANKHYSSNGFFIDVEDLQLRYNPDQWFFDGNPYTKGNIDAMYSIVRAYREDAVIISNAPPEQGDADLKFTENARYWDNVLGTALPWATPDNKKTAIQAWRHPFAKVNDRWSQWHHGQVRDDWRNFAKANIIEMCTGQIADFDQMPGTSRGPGTDTNWFELKLWPIESQQFIDMREAYAHWINPILESLIGTNPGPLEDTWGYSTQRDNLIYMHIMKNSVGKSGMPSGGNIVVSPVNDTVTNVTLLRDGTVLPYTQNGNSLTVHTSGIEVDSIDTVIKIETDKPFTGFKLTSIKATGSKTGDSTIQINVEGYLNHYVSLKADITQISYTSSNTSVATVDSNGLVTAVGEGTATITSTVEHDNEVKADSIDVKVEIGNNIRVADTLIGAVARVVGKEIYYGKMYHQDITENITIEGRGSKGGTLDISGASITYHTDNTELVDIDSNGVISVKTTVTDSEQVAVWATVTFNGITVTTNKVFIDVSDEKVVSENKPATARDYSETFTPDKANDGIALPADGSDSSKWRAGSIADNGWWQVDLQDIHSIYSVDINFNDRDDGYINVPKSITFQVSNDGINWTTKLSKVTNLPNNGDYSCTEANNYILAANGRYLRLLFEDGAQGDAIEIAEVKVWSKDTLADQMVTVSSTFNNNYIGENAVDGIIGQNGTGEWASLGELNPWIQIDYLNEPKTINKITLYDRSNTDDNILGGTLTFSDGSSISVTGIPEDGSAKEVLFPQKTVSWVKFQGSGGVGYNNGLSEIVIENTNLPPSNIAPHATTTASSEFDNRYVPANAIDETASEWASKGELNPWIQLDWSTSQTINKILLSDRVNTDDHTPGGTLTFSDGSSVQVTDMNNDGTPLEVTFPDKTVTWVRFQVTGGTGYNNGLAELEVYGN